MSNIVQLVENFKKTQAEMMAKLKQDGKAELAIVFKDVFEKHPGLKGFAFVGSTPGFNDGDPCTHTGYSYVGNFHTDTSKWHNNGAPYYTADYVDERGSGELEGFFVDEDVDLDDTAAPLDFLNKDCKTIDKAAIEVAKLEDIVEFVYDTNYLIKVSLASDGSVFVEYDDYDCGY